MFDPEIVLIQAAEYDPNCASDSFWDGSELAQLTLPECMVLKDDSVSMRSTRKNPAGCDGSRRFGGLWNERKIEVMGPIDASSASALRSLGSTIKEFAGRPGLKLSYEGRYLNLSFVDRIVWNWTNEQGHEIVDARLSWYLQDPFWYEDSITEFSDSVVAGSDTLTFSTGCLFRVWPRITLTLSASTPTSGGNLFELTNTDSGLTFELRNGTAMVSGDSVVINMEAGTVEAYVAASGPDPVDIKSSFFGEFFWLVPGSNDLDYTAAVDMDVDIEWRVVTL